MKLTILIILFCSSICHQLFGIDTQNSKANSNENDLLSGNEISIKFKEFTVKIENLEAWDEEGNLNKIQTDTVQVYLELGEILGENFIQISNCDFDKVELFQRFENSITIMNEGPHCDLLEWKHYTSDWKEVEKLNGLTFKANTMTEEQMELFIPVDLDEFRKAVKMHCGEKWAELIKEIKTINDYPCGIGTSKIELKIKLTSNETNSIIEKLIQFDIPMGC